MAHKQSGKPDLATWRTNAGDRYAYFTVYSFVEYMRNHVDGITKQIAVGYVKSDKVEKWLLQNGMQTSEWTPADQKIVTYDGENWCAIHTYCRGDGPAVYIWCASLPLYKNIRNEIFQ